MFSVGKHSLIAPSASSLAASAIHPLRLRRLLAALPSLLFRFLFSRSVGFVPRRLRYSSASAATAPRRLAFATASFPFLPLRRLRPSPPPLFIRFGCDGSSPPCLRCLNVSF